MPRVTICFAAPDAAQADRVAAWATDRGFDVDRLTGTEGGADARLIDADALLLIVTPNWMASASCRAVFREASRLRRPVFPIMVSAAGELVVGSDVSRLTLNDGEAAGLEWLAGAIDGAATAALAGRSAFRFCAFISYSHTDKKHARWLHRKIEAFRMPKALVGRTTAFGRVGRRLGKAFRDDEDLKGAANLGALIQGALEESETLVVICSPRSARSAYVNDEIASFKRLRRDARVIPVIIDGKPHDPECECFPPAITRGTDGAVSEAEPLAVDLREHGRRRALLKVIAGITGLEFDELERRDRRRRSLQIRTVAAAAMLVLGVLLGIGAVVEQNVGRQALIDRAARMLAERQPVLAAHLAVAGLPKASDLWPAGAEAAPTLMMSGYGFPTRLLDPQTRFADVLLTSDGKRLITRSLDKAVRIWDVERGTPIADLDFNYYSGETTFESMRLSPDETRLVLSNSTGPAQLWDAHTGRWITDLGQADHREVTFSADGRWIATLFVGGAALFHASTGDLVAEYGSADWVKVSANGSRVVTRLQDAVVLWEGPTGGRIADLDARHLSDLELTPDGTRLFLLKRPMRSVTLWDAVHGRQIARLPGDVDSMEMSEDGTRIATTTSMTREAVLWDAADGRRIGAIGREGTDKVNFSKAHDVVVAYASRLAPVVSDARTGARIGEIGSAEEGAGGLTFVPGRERVVLLTKDIALVLRNSRSGAFVARLADDNDAYGLQISKDGKLIQAKDANHWVKLWDGDSGALIGALAATREGHSWMIDRNNVHAVTRAIDGTVRLRRIEREVPSPAALRDRVCRANRGILGAFPAAERNADTPAGRALRGRPWHACDWRGLGTAEGWMQLTRYWGTRAGLPWDFEAGEK